MSMQQIMRWGHDFLRIRGGIFKPLGQWGKAKCQRENPSNCQLPFLSHLPNHLLLPKIGWVGYCMGWERCDNPNSNWRSHQFLGNMFWLLGQVKTQKFIPFYHAFTSSCFPHHFSFTWALSGILNFLCVKPFMFLVFPTILELLEFTIHILCCVLHFS